MSATKSKPAGRAVSKEPKVRVRKVRGFVESLRQDDFIVTGYTGSAKKLKRLVEIAGMDEPTLAAFLHDAGYSLVERLAISLFMGHWERVSLSTAQGRKGAK